MERPPIRQKANEIALGFDSYFVLSDLTIRLKNEGITDPTVAAETLDSLHDSGLVKYQEVGKGIWVYESRVSFDPNSENSQKVAEEIKRREEKVA